MPPVENLAVWAALQPLLLGVGSLGWPLTQGQPDPTSRVPWSSPRPWAAVQRRSSQAPRTRRGNKPTIVSASRICPLGPRVDALRSMLHTLDSVAFWAPSTGPASTLSEARAAGALPAPLHPELLGA